jgi:activator of HSP90 ATPase
MTSRIQLDAVFEADARRLYDILLDSKQFSAFTGGAPAHIDASEGGAFSMFGGMITGRNIELAPHKRIVQAWRAGNWPEGDFSIVRFDFVGEGSGARLTLTQTGFPEAMRVHLESGWAKMYFEPLRAYTA